MEVMDVIRRVLLGMLEAVEGELCLLEVLEVMRFTVCWGRCAVCCTVY